MLKELEMDILTFSESQFPMVLQQYDQLSMSVKRMLFSTIKVPNGLNKFRFELVKHVQNHMMSQIDAEELR